MKRITKQETLPALAVPEVLSREHFMTGLYRSLACMTIRL